MDKQIKQKRKSYNKPKLTVDELSAALFQANQKLQKKNQELISMQQTQNEIFANISHDLRSPITAIRSGIEYLTTVDHIEEAEKQKIFRLLTTRIIGLEEMINDIFLLTKLGQESIPLEMSTLGVGALLEEYYYNLIADNKYACRQLRMKVPEKFDYEIEADVSKLIRVLDNLFTNAYKYTKDNDVIELGARKDKKMILIWVKDTGIGIPKELCEKVFERSFMVSSARTPEFHQGAGLGLSIARAIITRHGGSIWCESQPSYGSTFYFTLPYKTT